MPRRTPPHAGRRRPARHHGPAGGASSLARPRGLVGLIGLVGLAGLVSLVGLLTACGSSVQTGAGASTTTVMTTGPVTRIPAVTPAEASALTVTVPFSADRLALVVTAGDAPTGFTSAHATQLFASILNDTYGDPSPAMPLGPHELLAGRVSLASGLGAPAMHQVAAWVLVYQGVMAACPAMFPDTTERPPPVWASGLHALILTRPEASDVISYLGAGTGLCGPTSTQPRAHVGSVNS